VSSFVRTLQRTLKRADKPDCHAPHYMGRGRKLGVTNPAPRKKKPKPNRAITLADKITVRSARKATLKTRVHAVPLSKQRTRGFTGHNHGHEGMMRTPAANLSRGHPDYGVTPAEHARRKAERLV
jgi:hypothetical protein